MDLGAHAADGDHAHPAAADPARDHDGGDLRLHPDPRRVPRRRSSSAARRGVMIGNLIVNFFTGAAVHARRGGGAADRGADRRAAGRVPALARGGGCLPCVSSRSSRPHARLVAARCSASGRSLIYVFLFAPIVLLVAVQLQREPVRHVPVHRLDAAAGTAQVFHDYQIQDALTTTLRIAFEVTVDRDDRRHRGRVPARARRGCRSAAASASGSTLPIMIPGLLIGVSLLVPASRRVPPAAVADDGGDRPGVSTRRRSSCCSSRRGCRGSTERSSGPRATSARTRIERLRYVVLPLIAPAIFAGALFAFTLSLDEFIITLFLIGGAQHAADLHLHAGEVRDHARGERARDAAPGRVARA